MIADSLVQEAAGEALIIPRLSYHGIFPAFAGLSSRSIPPLFARPFAPSLWGNNRPTHQRIMIC
jgi:hypothetical protein